MLRLNEDVLNPNLVSSMISTFPKDIEIIKLQDLQENPDLKLQDIAECDIYLMNLIQIPGYEFRLKGL